MTARRILPAITGLLLVATFLSGCDEERTAAPPTPTTGTAIPAVIAAKAATAAVDPWAVVPTQPRYRATPARLAEPAPARIVAAAVGIDSELIPLGLRADGTMEVPKDFTRAGWFTGGPKPGETGPAVIAGHVDSTSGPAAFYRLGDLHAGDDVVVTRADGTRVTFRVTRVEVYEKRAFPTDAVFRPTSEPELRLVTCGGDFDWSRLSYESNIVVYAAALPM